MFKGIRFFLFSNNALDFRELNFFKTKVLSAGLLFGVLCIGLILIVNHFANDLLGLGYDRLTVLDSENRILKERIRELSQQMVGLQGSLDEISEQGNELRLKVDLSQINDDTRQAAVGGTSGPSEFSFLSEGARESLVRSERLIDDLSREVALQRASYTEIHNRYEYNKEFFKHLPAIKPMLGFYSVHGYGMRVHPVLRVYRMHEGVDILGDVGTDVYATGDGVVRYAGRTQGGYGAVIEISHEYGYSTLYAHLSKVLVRPGRRVTRGQLIAQSGRSGLVSGPHLHYEVRYKGRKQNPIDYFFDDVEAARYRIRVASAN
jgi:murein DD-endopeptidase MepM/ murein hydrolase activator NlpD